MGETLFERLKNDLTIDRSLIHPKLVYFLLLGGQLSLLSFLSLYLHELGLSGSQIGVLRAVRPFMSFFVGPILTLLADKLVIHLPMFLCSIAIATILRALLYFIGDHFLVLLSVIVIAEIIVSPVTPLLNHFVLQRLGPKKEIYGKQRLFGSLGVGILTFIVGLIVNSTKSYFWCFGVMLIACLCSLYPAYNLKPESNTSISYKPVDSPLEKPEPMLKQIKLLLSNLETLSIYVISFIMGTAGGIHSVYIYIYLQGLGGTKLLFGISSAISCFSELPFFFYSSELMRKLTPKGALGLSIVCYAIRLGYYSLLENPWFVLPIELFHGITFAVFWSAAVNVVSSNAPSRLAATSQSLLTGFYEGLGNVFGTIVGGALYDKYGLRVTYRVSSMTLFGICVLFGLYQLALYLKKRKSTDIESTKVEEEEQQIESKFEIESAEDE